MKSIVTLIILEFLFLFLTSISSEAGVIERREFRQKEREEIAEIENRGLKRLLEISKEMKVVVKSFTTTAGGAIPVKINGRDIPKKFYSEREWKLLEQIKKTNKIMNGSKESFEGENYPPLESVDVDTSVY